MHHRPLRRFRQQAAAWFVASSLITQSFAAAPADQNFDAITAGTLSALNGSLTFSGVVYSADTVDDQLAVDTISNITGGYTSLGSGNGLSSVWNGTNTGTTLTIALNGQAGVFALAGDTDGIDGTEDNAGAIATPDSLARARQRGLDADARLADNDGYGFFTNLGDLVVTGPTLTNVNDFRAILILPA